MSIDAYIQNERRDFSKEGMLLSDVPENPYQLFSEWMNLALKSKVVDANAMTISTVNAKGLPQTRVVLLRDVNEQGFVFYTNYSSSKGKAIAVNPQVSLNFFWPETNRQIRIQGYAEKVSEETSKTYFASRPRKSQLGALVSHQSEVISSRKVLEEKMNELIEKYEGKEIPKPTNWGGYIVKPSAIEFWLGRPSRLHDRILYQKQGNISWEIQRLSP